MDNFPVVGIGASAGGLKSLEAFFRSLTKSFDGSIGAAFVVVTHLDPRHKSLMGELLSNYTSLGVQQAENGMAIKADNIYVIPPNASLTMQNGELRLHEPVVKRGIRQPIDDFLRSLARERGEDAVCIILSGTGSDGTLGLKEIKAEGGMTIAQDPTEAEYSGMPQSAIDTGMVDVVLPVADMPDTVVEYLNRARNEKTNGTIKQPMDGDPSKVDAILEHLREEHGHDFFGYKRNTIHRRLHKRMLISGVDGPDDYLELLSRNGVESEAMFKDLLIGVTSFFRDPEAFDILAAQVAPVLVGSHGPDDPVRIWVPGCSTGEEAFSLAMLMREQMERQKRQIPLQVFATDVDSVAIEVGRTGVYPGSVAADVTPERLSRFFRQEEDAYKVDAQVREDVVFASHNIIADPPFIKQDLISCRNLLIYLSPETQKRIIPLLFYALKPGGFLFLGPSETLGEHADLFEPLDKRWKIFRRKRVSLKHPLDFPVFNRHRQTMARTSPAAEQPQVLNPKTVIEREQLKRRASPAILVNHKGQVLGLYGDLDPYLRIPDDELSADVGKIARDHVRVHLRTSLHRADQIKDTVRMNKIRFSPDDARAFDLIVHPVDEPTVSQRLYMAVFEERQVKEPEITGELLEVSSDLSRDDIIKQLEEQLKMTQEQLQRTIEDHETANEELKSSNEELMSMNEELQSTNEEMETSKEELQALNEELSSVNAELQAKVMELGLVNADIENLLKSTRIATLFLSRDLVIRRYTPPTADIFNIVRSDIGRPVHHLTSKLSSGVDLQADCQKVLETRQMIEEEVQTTDGRTYLTRFTTYLGHKDAVEGVVVTFVDITELKKAREDTVQLLEELRISEERLSLAVDATGAGVFDHPLPLENGEGEVYFSKRYGEILGIEGGEVPSSEHFHHWFQDRVLLPDREAMHQAFDDLASGAKDQVQMEVRFLVGEGDARCLLIFAKSLSVSAGKPERVVGMVLDVSDRRLMEEELLQHKNNLEQLVDDKSAELAASERKFSAIFQNSPAMLVLTRLEDGTYKDVNPAYCDLTGYTCEELVGRTGKDVGIWVDHEDRDRFVQQLQDKGWFESQEVQLRNKDGQEITAIVSGELLDVNGEPVILTAGLDITDRKKAEESLRESEKRYRLMGETIPYGVWSTDAEGRCDYISPSFLEMVGKSFEELQEFGWTDRLVPEDVEPMLEKWMHCVRTGEQWDHEHHFISKQGETRTVLARGLPVRNEAGEITSWVGVNLDITDRKKMEQALRESQADLVRAQAVAKVGSWWMDIQANRLEWSDECYKIFGVQKDTPLTYELFLSLVHPGDKEFVNQQWQAAIKGEPYDIEHRILVDGEVKWVRELASLDVDQDGKLVGGFGTAQDITDRKQAEDSLRESTHFLSRVLEASQNGLYVYDIEKGTNVFINPRYTDITGYTLDELNTLSPEEFFTLFHPDDQEAVLTHMQGVMQDTTDTPHYIEYRFLTKDGRWIWCHSRDVVFDRGEDGMPARFIGGFVDVTAYMSATSELQLAKQEAERANQAKSDFLANMSHELRTPITGILGAAQVMNMEQLTPQQREMLEVMEHSANALLYTVNDILDLSKIVSHGIELHEASFDVHSCVHNTVKLYSFQAREKDLDMQVDIADGVPGYLLGDEHRLGQVLRNLISNAVKFTVKGGVKVNVAVDKAAPPTKDGAIPLVFSVLDTGPGIPSDKMGSLFKEFSQLDDSYSKQHGGTGLGLAICKKLVELMGGGIGVDSTVGQGSKFTVRVALRPGESPHMEDGGQYAPHQPVSPRRILVAEDNEVNQVFLQTVLESEGHTVTVAANGREALEELKKQPYSLVLMDVQMPHMDGLEATRRIRSGDDPDLPRDIPIIALTAYAMSGDREKFLAAGMDDYLSKPFTIEALSQALKTIKPRVRTEGEAALLDLEGLRLRYKTRWDFLEKMLPSFEEQHGSEFADLETLISEKKFSRAADMVHSMAGGAKTLGMMRLGNACLTLENRLRSNGNTDLLSEVTDLQKLFDESLKALKADLKGHGK